MAEVGGLSSSNTLRFMGMASGVDTDAMVKKMLMNDKFKIAKVEQSKQNLQWKQGLYRDIIKDLDGVKSKYFDVLSNDYILSENKFLDNKVESSDEFILTSKAYSEALEGTYKVKVNEIAKSARLESEDKLAIKDKTSKLTDLVSHGVYTFDIKYNGTKKTINLDNSKGDKTLTDFINAINNETQGNVITRYSELTGRCSISTSKTGKEASIEIFSSDVNTIGFLKDKLKLKLNFENKGQNSSVTITSPGSSVATTVEKSTNNFTIDGVNYNLNSESAKEVTLTVRSDRESSFKKIKSFIDDYNKVVDKVYKRVEEKRQYKYKSLTEEQKKEMSKEDIEKWEQKAKEGLLKNDPDLQNMLINLRNAFFTPVEGSGIKFDERKLGIGTSNDISERGKIFIKDEVKFKENLKSNGEQIMRLFVKRSDVTYSRTLSITEKKKRISEEGIFNRINDILNDYISPMRDKGGKKAPLIEKAGFEKDPTFLNNMITKQIAEKENLIKSMMLKMSEKENRYYLMFSRVEKAMNKLNAQSNWIASQMGSRM